MPTWCSLFAPLLICFANLRDDLSIEAVTSAMNDRESVMDDRNVGPRP